MKHKRHNILSRVYKFFTYMPDFDNLPSIKVDLSLALWHSLKLAAVFEVAMVAIACFYYFFVERKGHAANLSKWSDRMKLTLSQVYLYLLASYLLLFTSIAVSSQTILLRVVSFSPKFASIAAVSSACALSTALDALPDSPEYKAARVGIWVVQSVVLGPIFALFDNYISVAAGIYTMVAAFLANWLAMSADVQLYDQIKTKIGILYALVCLSTGLCVWRAPPIGRFTSALVTFNIFGGVVLFFGLFVATIQNAVLDSRYQEVDPLNVSATAFFTTVNLYFRLALFQVVENAGLLNSASRC